MVSIFIGEHYQKSIVAFFYKRIVQSISISILFMKFTYNGIVLYRVLKSVVCYFFSLQCSYGCKPTPQGARCFCPDGKKPEGNKCVDADECEWDESCAQKCANTPGSYKCSCVSGYTSMGRDCMAINCK